MSRPPPSRARIPAALLLIVMLAWAQSSQSAGIDRIPGWNLPSRAVVEGPRWVDALGDLRFAQPVALLAPPGETNRLFVAEKSGLIVAVTNLAAPTRTVFLDLRTNLYAGYLEAGLLGVAFHPGYATNRQFFVWRTVRGARADGQPAVYDVLARFEGDPVDPNRALARSEVVLIRQEDRQGMQDLTHNAGDLQFGPDGYLYVSLGDEMAPPEQADGQHQPLTRFFGAILRLDVDQRPGSLAPNPGPAVGSGYSIPPDNPLVGARSYQGRALDPFATRTEFFAIGFRNPWRMSFHPQSGELWVADVGSARWEEINVVRSGGNYGWPYREGKEDGIYGFLTPAQAVFSEPRWVYAHGSATNQGNSVIGGAFYLGHAFLSHFSGGYVFADCRSGHTWLLDTRSPDANSSAPEWLCTEPGISAFANDPRDGEILAANFVSGSVRKLVPPPAPSPGSEPPPTLREAGVFTDLATLEPDPRLHAYEINATFWSDGAFKRRWVAAPAGLPPRWRSDGLYAFEPGTLWVKHFELERTNGIPGSRHRVETRLLVKTLEGVYGLSYRWVESGTDAVLVPAAGEDRELAFQDGPNPRAQVWHFPGRAECLRCHDAASAYALGYCPEQLDRPLQPSSGTPSQLAALAAKGQVPVSPGPADPVPGLVSPEDASRPLELRARSYLAANCAACHRPGRLTDTTAEWDARSGIPLRAMGVLDGRLVLPGNPIDSRLLQVLNRATTDLRMPPLASNVPDSAGIGLLTRWIAAIPHAPWSREDLGAASSAGFSTLEESGVVLGGSGAGLPPRTQGVHWLRRRLEADGFLSARLSRFEATAANSIVAVGMISATNAPEAYFIAGVDGRGTSFITASSPVDAGPASPSSEQAVGSILRVDRRGSRLEGSVSSGGVGSDIPFSSHATDVVSADAPCELGWMVASGDPVRPAHAWLDRLRWCEASWLEPGDPFHGKAGLPLTLELAVAAEGLSIRRVEFLADGVVVDGVTAPPFRVVWPSPRPGVHVLSARVHFTDDAPLEVRPRTFVAEATPASATFLAEDRATQGDWQGRYGATAYHLGPAGSSPAAGFSLGVEAATEVVWESATSDRRALQRPSGFGRTAAGWKSTAAEGIRVLASCPDATESRLAVYLLDWPSIAEPVESITLLDADHGTALDQRTVHDFGGGVYLTWRIQGRVLLRIEGAPDSTAVFSGVFLDAPPDGASRTVLAVPANPADLRAPASVGLRADALVPAWPPTRVDFLANGVPVGSATGPELATTWSDVAAGDYRVVARAWDGTGRFADSAPVQIQVRAAPAAALFVGEADVAGGAWSHRLGSEARLVAPDHAELSSNQDLRIDVGDPYLWVPWTNLVAHPDPRGVQFDPSSVGEGACWTAPAALVVSIDLRDGRWHLGSLYFVDWDTDLRDQTVEIVDAQSGEVLDSREVSRFFSGRWLVFWGRGSLQVRVIPHSVNAVLSGVFLDPAVGATPRMPRFTSVHWEGRGCQLEWEAGPGSLSRLWSAPALVGPWSVGPVISTSTDGRFRAGESGASSGAGARFFRLELLSEGNGPLRRR